MKYETFFEAQKLDLNISQIIASIESIDKNKGANSSAPPINLPLFESDELTAVNATVLKHLKARKNALQKQFDNLK